MSGAVRVRNVDVTYRPLGGAAHRALQDVSFEVPAGSTFGLVGANGAGKTTLLRTVAGLIAPAQGKVRVMGLCPVRERSRVMQRTGVLLSGKRHFPERWLVRDALTYTALLYGVRDTRQVEGVAAEFGLGDKLDQQVTALSLGNRQRLSLAATFVHAPEVALLDEPTLALDTASIERFLVYLKARAAQGKTTLITSHDHALLGRLVGGVVVLSRGRVAPQVDAGSGPFLRLQVTRPPAEALPAGAVWEGDHVRLPLSSALLAQVCAELAAQGIELLGLRVEHSFEGLVTSLPGQGSAHRGEAQDAHRSVA